jgi:hypothetical protein
MRMVSAPYAASDDFSGNSQQHHQDREQRCGAQGGHVGFQPDIHEEDRHDEGIRQRRTAVMHHVLFIGVARHDDAEQVGAGDRRDAAQCFSCPREDHHQSEEHRQHRILPAREMLDLAQLGQQFVTNEPGSREKDRHLTDGDQRVSLSCQPQHQ